MYLNTPQDCLSFTANTTPTVHPPSESPQNVVSPDNSTINITGTHYNTPQDCLSLEANTTPNALTYTNITIHHIR